MLVLMMYEGQRAILQDLMNGDKRQENTQHMGDCSAVVRCHTNWAQHPSTENLSVQIPSKEQVDALSAELAERGKDIPAHVDTILTDLPPGTHPMTQFSIATLALQVNLDS